MESGMIEAGAVFAALIAALRVIEKLVDKRLNNGTPRASTSPEVAMQLAAISESSAATTQTLERINDKLDEMDMRHAAMATISGVIDGRVKDIQNVAHEVHVICKEEHDDYKERKLLEKLKAAQTGSQPVTA